MVANPVDTPLAYDSFRLVGVLSPGVCRFPSAPTRDEGWDVQAPSGTGGGYTIHHRTPPIEFDVEVYLWKGENEYGVFVDEFTAWDKFEPLLFIPVKRNSPKALAFQHPLTDGLNPAITQVVVKSHTKPLPDGKGGGTVKIRFIEYRPLIFKPIKGPAGVDTSKSDPNADLKRKVRELTATFQQVGGS